MTDSPSVVALPIHGVPDPAPARRAWLLALLFACYACGFIDRLIIAIVGPAIVRELGLSDLEFGLLGGLAFALFFSIFGIPIAWAAERRSRIAIIAVSVAAWSVMTMASAGAETYLMLLLCRVGVGLGEAGYAPISHATISDAYPRERRASALAVFSLGVPVGALIGAVAGGALAQAYGWRTAMLALGAPGLLLALLVALTVKDPPRGRGDARTGGVARPSPAAAARSLLSSRALIHITAGASLTTVAANGINLFAPTYFVRRFGLGLAEAGGLYGLVLGIAGTAGILAGGLIADAAARRDVRWYAWLPAASAALAAPLYVLGYTRPTLWSSLSVVFAGALCVSFYIGPAIAAIQNVAGPALRASASAFLLFCMNVLGQGLGPLVMGWLSDQRATRVFVAGPYAALCAGGGRGDLADACAHAAASGLQYAIVMTSVVAFGWGAVHFLLAARTMARDIAHPLS